MQTHNKRKSDQLGIPFGTASGRLRKNIIFHLLQKHGENVCFVCRGVIATVDDLSIEHKKPWQDRDTALFWDINNIAFSHPKCNRPHERGRKIGPPGKSWCWGCKDYLPNAQFNAETRRWNGLRPICKLCMKHQRPPKKK